jgi:hypothetical protein
MYIFMSNEAMQEGAQTLSQEEARGAAVLRHLSVSKLQHYLKRKHEGDPGSSDAWQQIAMAQTSLSEAKAANREFQEQGQHKRKMLRPAVNDVDDLWSPKVQQVLESNALMRSVMVDFLSTDDLAMARTLHMEGFLLFLHLLLSGLAIPGPGHQHESPGDSIHLLSHAHVLHLVHAGANLAARQALALQLLLEPWGLAVFADEF